MVVAQRAHPPGATEGTDRHPVPVFEGPRPGRPQLGDGRPAGGPFQGFSMGTRTEFPHSVQEPS